MLRASNDVESDLFCVTRTFEMLRDIGSAPNIESARDAALTAAVGADVVMVVMHDELVRLGERSVELGVEMLADVGLPVLLLTGLGDEQTEDFARAALWLRRNVRGVLASDATASEIAAGVRAVRAGLVVIEPRIAQELHQTSRRRPASRITDNGLVRAPDQSPPLSAREREVLGLLAEGLATKNIAHQLGISAHTVKAHVESIFAKFGATTRAEAVAIGVRRGAVLL
ncbi:MAG: response regulator transcription factor [Phycisphaerae bacterium]|nr:response regulator transcription factor [Gemmatimonadaceae bacterium]